LGLRKLRKAGNSSLCVISITDGFDRAVVEIMEQSDGVLAFKNAAW